MPAVFVTSSGTDVGKTFVTLRLLAELRAAGRRARALKPIASGFDAAAAARFGIERSRPLVAVPLDEKQLAARKLPPAEPLLRVEPAEVIVTSLKPSRDGKALMLRLFNPGTEACKVALNWASAGPKQVHVSSPDETEGEAVSGTIELPGQGILTLRCR